MNLILIILDSFRQDHVSEFNQGRRVFPEVPACQTPNLDAFAQESIVFENAYPEALPTIPIRTQLFTGQATLPFRPWQPLTREDVTAAEILGTEGYVCGLITDTYHYRAPGMNFHRGFHTHRWIRGQEYDPYRSHPLRRSLDDYVNANYDAGWRERITQFLVNTDDFKDESDWFSSQVVDQASEWLRDNRAHQRLFAVIDCFDPHEPWDPPPAYNQYLDPNYQGKRLIMPMGGPAEAWATSAEIDHIRGLYAGEAAFVDDCLGRLFATLQEQGYYEDSVIVVMADHGHPLADHGKFFKGGDRLYNELLRVPFMVRLPGGAGARRTPALVQFHDVLPTLLELAGLGNNAGAMHGRSFVPVLRGDTDAHRPAIITGFREAFDRCIRDTTWTYIQRPEGQPDELYNLFNDPQEQNNLIDEHPDEAQRLAGLFGNVYYRGRARATVKGKGIMGKYETSSGVVP